jgi:hypothetical protein
MADADDLDEMARLARRAAALRAVAADLDRSIVHRLRSLSGPDTWSGPTAVRFDEVALAAARAADAARDDLRAAAHRLELRADEVQAEQIARVLLS